MAFVVKSLFQTRATSYFDPNIKSIDNSKSKIIKYFGNEAGPGVLHSGVQQTRTLQEFSTTWAESKNCQSVILSAFGIFAAFVFLER